MKTLIVGTLVLIVCFSCSKFEHEDVNIEIPSCELCAWADSLEGDYAGDYNYSFDNYMGQNDTIDSLHFTVQHIFLNQGPLDDSTRMFFQVTRSGGNFTGDGTSIWIADDSTNVFRNTGFNEIRMSKDSMILNDGYSVPFFGGGSSYISRNGVFYR